MFKETFPSTSRLTLNKKSETEAAKASEAKKVEGPKAEPEKPIPDGCSKEAVKIKKDRRSSIFATFTKRRKDDGEEAAASTPVSAMIKPKKGKKKSVKGNAGAEKN